MSDDSEDTSDENGGEPVSGDTRTETELAAEEARLMDKLTELRVERQEVDRSIEERKEQLDALKRIREAIVVEVFAAEWNETGLNPNDTDRLDMTTVSIADEYDGEEFVTIEVPTPVYELAVKRHGREGVSQRISEELAAVADKMADE